MNGLTRARLLAPAALFAACLALALPGLAAGATTPTYIKETQQEYEKQLNSGEISSTVFNKKVRNLHITLKDGKLYIYHYGKKESPKLEDQLRAHHITITVLTPAEANKELKKKPVHHKLRYIAGGILIVVIIVIGVVLLVNRRRRHAEE